MIIRLVVIVALFLPLRVIAWEDEAVLSFISQVNPLIKAQKNVSNTFTKPDTLTWALRNTSLSGRLGFGGTDFRDDPYTVYGGLQINIPLSSIKEDREQAMKQVSEVKAMDTINGKVIADIVKMRTLESELAASEVRRKFLKEKAKWIKQRIEEGYSSEMNELWTIGSKLNTEDALIAKVDVLAKTQRYKLAKYAGAEWKTLLAYLKGQGDALGGHDG
jgi:hypothetical protein